MLRYDPNVKIKLRRLLTNPKTRVLSRDSDVTRLQVEGLVCDSVCAVRTRQALLAIDGVTDVAVDFETGVATVHGRPNSDEEYDRAVTGVVAGGGLRGFIERVASLLGRRPQAAA
jgi:hypothetical protein